MKLKKSIAIVLTMVLLLGVMPLAAQATDWGEGDTLDDALSELKVGFGSTYLDWLMLPNLGVVNFRYSYFQYKNERTGTVDEHPVYCIDPTKGGAYEIVKNVGKNTDGSDTATYIRGEKVGDAKYKAIMAAGFPQMRYSSLGLQSEEEGYYATKLALWMYIRGNDPSKLTINPKYGNSDPVALRVRAAAVQIYTTGTKSTGIREPKLTLTGKPSATANLDASSEYYVQGVEVYASGYIGTDPAGCGDVQLSWDSPPPAGTIVLGSDGEDITSTLAVKMTNNNGYNGKVTIKYPASEVDPETFSPPTLNAKAIVPNDAIYVAYAKVNKTKYQRYLVASDPKIELAASFVSQLTWQPEKDPPDSGLRIRKLQKGTNTPLEGAVFEVRDPDGKLIYSMATDASGIIDLPLYIAGNYTVTEVTPPEYHLLSDIRTLSVTVKYGEVAEVTFTNAPYGTLRVVKVDASNGMPLGGAAVQIKNITTNTTQSAHTDSSGCAVFEKLPVGAYEIVEITSPDGYELDSTPRTVNVVPLNEGETSYTLTNKANPGLRITKFDRQTMMPIEGVTFEVWHDGELFGTYTTDTWGEIELRDIPAGTYTAREVATVSPYTLDPTAQWIEIKAGQGYISDLYFFNLVKPGINLIKIDSETFEPLVNARFLIKLVGGSFAKEYTTDANGEINLSELDPGAYTVQELTAPDGYLIDDAIRTIQINAGENAQFVFTNTKKPVLEVLKFDGTNYLPGATFRIALIKDGSHYLDRITDTNGRIRIEDLEPGIYSVKELQPPPGYLPNETEFLVELFPGRTSQLVVNNVRKPDLLIVKTDANTGLPIEGVTYTVRKVDSSTLETVKTDKNGEAWMYLLDEGVYQITEQSVPPRHLLDETPQLITLVGGRTGVVRFQNYPRPKLQILKVDVITGERLPNAEFRVSKVEGSTVSEYITDASGEILIENLDVAIYKAEEFMPPDGYIRYEKSKQIQLQPGKTSVLKFDNIRKPTLIITKSNGLTYEPIPNTTYKIEHEQTDGGVYPMGTYKTDANGQIVIKNATPGWYIITETIPAPGFNPSANPVTRKYLAPGENAYTIADTNGEPGDVSGNNIRITSGADYISMVGEEIINYPLNSIVIRKVNANTGELLAGAAFEVRQVNENVSGSSGTLIGRYTTANSGTIVITGLTPGGYIVTEVQAPPNYLLSENSQQQVWLKPDGTSIVETTFANWPYGGILITKVDTLTNKPLANARFRVTDSTGAVVGNTNGEYITDSNGEIFIPNVKPGAYVVTEIEAPQHYVVDTTPQTIDVGLEGKIYKVSFKNQPAGALTILKYDTATREPLAGAEFKVTDSTGAVVGTGNGKYTTDATGKIVIPNLPKGSYIVQETKAPDGYILENQQQTIAVDYGKTYTLEFYNKKMSGLQIIKIDSVTKQPLKAAEFTVYKQSGEIVDRYVTDADGVIIVDTLSPGWYKVVETKTLPGYVLDETPKDVLITDNQFVRVVFENAPMSGLIIRKVDADTRDPLEGAEFTVKTAGGLLIGIYRSGTDGIANIPLIEPGWYTVTETKAPEGYTLGDNVQTVQITNSKTVTIEFQNRAFGSLVIKKIDEITGKPLSGANFTVSKQGGAFMGEYTTDIDGTVNIPSAAPGWYVVSETKAPAGYTLDSTAKTVEVKPVVPSVVTFTNKPIGGLKLVKLDADTRNTLKGAVFEVRKMTGAIVGQYTTDDSGIIALPELESGWYTAVELKTPNGYRLDSEPHNIEVKYGQTAVLEVTNHKQASLIIRKLNSVTGEPLQGAVFTVTDSSGAPIGPDNGRFTTDKYGQITITQRLIPGAMLTVRELSAPEGFIMDADPQTLTVKADTTHTLTFLNTPMSGLVIKKMDSVTKSPLSGVTFKVTSSNGSVVGAANGEYVTDATGVINITGLKSDTYVVQEIKAKDGYLLDTTAKTIEIKDAKVYNLDFYNQPLGGLLITKKDSQTLAPISGVTFKITRSDGTVVGTANGEYVTDSSGSIRIAGLAPATYLVTEVRAKDGYLLDSTVKSIEIKDNRLYTVEFLNTPVGGLKIVKLDEDTRGVLRGASFEVRRMNGELIGTYISNASGIIALPDIGNGWFTVTEVKPPEGYRLDSEPRNIEVKDGKTAVLEITNKKTASLMIEKTDSVTGKGIYGVTFILYDAGKNPIMQLITDQYGIAYADRELTAGKYFLRELEAAEGYELDTEWKTIYVEAGKTTHVQWANKPVMAQIQIVKYSSDYNSVTGAPAGSLLKGAVFEITRARSGVVVGYITTDARGVAASEPLPLGRYLIKEVTAPQYYQLSSEPFDVTLEYPGQIIRLSAYNKSANLGTEIKKVGNLEVIAGDSMRYDISIKNTSNVPLSDFYWSDRLPTDAARVQSITTGTYNQRLYYRIIYKTNYSEWRVLASNLLSTNNYSYNLSAAALGLMNGEVVTDIRYEFGTVAAGFASATKPTVTVQTLSTLANGYQIINRCEVGGKYGGAPQITTAAWVTKVVRYGPVPSLPKTGY